MKRFLCLSAVLVVSSAAVAQPDLGNVDDGRRLAKAVCAQCHLVDKGQKSHKLALPKAFQEIADNPARTKLSLRVFLKTPHRDMPNLIMTESETDDLIAYIFSLK